MTDQRVDVLIRRLDVPFEPDPAFIQRTSAVLTPIARDARRADRRPLGRLRRMAWTLVTPADRSGWRSSSQTAVLAAVVLIILALLASIALAGAVRRLQSGGNGLLLVAQAGTLQAVDPETSKVRDIATDVSGIVGVTRSPDGRLASFWTGLGQGDRLQIINLDDGTRRQIGLEAGLERRGCVDVWSPDSTRLAVEVSVGISASILVVDVASGLTRRIGPSDELPECPLWSPDGDSIAFAGGPPLGPRVLEVVRLDGTGVRQISGDLGDLDVQGPDSWSPDGAWIYFSAGNGGRGHVYRANVATGRSQQLTSDDLAAFAPTLSPDGSRVSYIVVGRGPGYDERTMRENAKYDLYVMGPDGSGAHLLLAHATNDGWAADGNHILAEWHPSGGALDGGLAMVSPDRGAPVILLPYGRACGTDGTSSCFSGVSWGQPTP